MHIGSCENCRYLDLMVNPANGCPRCGGRMVSLDVDSAVWNTMSVKEKEAVLDEKVPKQQDAEELFREWFALKPGGEDTVAEEEDAKEAVVEETVAKEAPQEDLPKDDPPETAGYVPAAEPAITEYVYVCYKCSSIAGHDRENDRYYCPECGSDMVETGLSTIEWSNLSKEEKRNVMEEAKIRHMVTAIKEASYEDSENEKTQSIIKVVGNNPYLNPNGT